MKRGHSLPFPTLDIRVTEHHYDFQFIIYDIFFLLESLSCVLHFGPDSGNVQMTYFIGHLRFVAENLVGFSNWGIWERFYVFTIYLFSSPSPSGIHFTSMSDLLDLSFFIAFAMFIVLFEGYFKIYLSTLLFFHLCYDFYFLRALSYYMTSLYFVVPCYYIICTITTRILIKVCMNVIVSMWVRFSLFWRL